MQPASRASVWIELVVAAAGIGAVALVHATHRPKRGVHEARIELTHIVPDIALRPSAPALEPIECDATLPDAVERAYREARFADAAQTAKNLDGCERTAELLQLLDREWRAGVAHDGDAATHLVALQRARSTDLSLGGAHADELDRAIAAIASRAAEIYLARAHETGCTDVEAAARALDDAALLGVRDEPRARAVIRERASLHCAATPSLAVDY